MILKWKICFYWTIILFPKTLKIYESFFEKNKKYQSIMLLLYADNAGTARL